MICAEIFVPGGVLGVLGTIAIISAVVRGFSVFGPSLGFLVMFLIFLFLAVVIWLWLKFFPKTRMGRALYLTSDGKSFKSADETYAELVGKSGITHTELRPAGSAVIDGRRLDVVTEGEMVSKDRPICVIKVSGNRIVVREAPESTA